MPTTARIGADPRISFCCARLPPRTLRRAKLADRSHPHLGPLRRGARRDHLIASMVLPRSVRRECKLSPSGLANAAGVFRRFECLIATLLPSTGRGPGRGEDDGGRLHDLTAARTWDASLRLSSDFRLARPRAVCYKHRLDMAAIGRFQKGDETFYAKVVDGELFRLRATSWLPVLRKSRSPPRRQNAASSCPKTPSA